MFSILTSKIFGATSLFLVVALVFIVVSYEGKVGTYQSQLEKADKKISGLQADTTTLRGNNLKLDNGLAQCNKSIDTMALTARTVSANSAAAVQAAQRGRKATTDRIETIRLMPVNTCADVKSVLKQGAK
jgi:hypothetical protein